AFEIINDIK
nr:RecName: Full=Peroxidase 9 [Cycas revoluta]